MIRIGISTGAGAWSTDELVGDHEIPFGSEIIKNRLSSYTGYFGYAIAVSDARGIVVSDNAIRFAPLPSFPPSLPPTNPSPSFLTSASIWGFQTDACYIRPSFALPAPLIRDTRGVMGSLQPEFRDLRFGFLLCVGPGSASTSHELSQHQINEAYIEQKGVRARTKGRPQPPAIPRDEVRSGPRVGGVKGMRSSGGGVPVGGGGGGGERGEEGGGG